MVIICVTRRDLFRVRLYDSLYFLIALGRSFKRKLTEVACFISFLPISRDGLMTKNFLFRLIGYKNNETWYDAIQRLNKSLKTEAQGKHHWRHKETFTRHLAFKLS